MKIVEPAFLSVIPSETQSQGLESVQNEVANSSVILFVSQMEFFVETNYSNNVNVTIISLTLPNYLL
jgi:hypothetical protein